MEYGYGIIQNTLPRMHMFTASKSSDAAMEEASFSNSDSVVVS